MSNISKEQALKQKAEKLSVGQVEHIAELARIELTEKEKEKFTKDLSSILDYVEKLNQIDTSEVEPIAQVTGLENVMREDKEIKSPKSKVQSKLLKEAPSKKGDYIKVPKILE